MMMNLTEPWRITCRASVNEAPSITTLAAAAKYMQ